MTLDEMRTNLDGDIAIDIEDVKALLYMLDAKQAEADWLKARVAELEANVADLTAQIMGSR